MSRSSDCLSWCSGLDMGDGYCSCKSIRRTVDPINHPPHYTHGKIEPIDVIRDWGLGFCLGNTVKYIARAEHKGSKLQDLEKARWYLDREIADLKAQQKETK